MYELGVLKTLRSAVECREGLVGRLDSLLVDEGLRGGRYEARRDKSRWPRTMRDCQRRKSLDREGLAGICVV